MTEGRRASRWYSKVYSKGEDRWRCMAGDSWNSFLSRSQESASMEREWNWSRRTHYRWRCCYHHHQEPQPFDLSTAYRRPKRERKLTIERIDYLLHHGITVVIPAAWSHPFLWKRGQTMSRLMVVVLRGLIITILAVIGPWWNAMHLLYRQTQL